MIIRTTIATLALLALAGCGSSDAKDAGVSVSADKIVDRMGKMVRPEPGLYRSTSTVISVEAPGAPAGVADMLKKSMSSGQTSEYCLTPEEAAKGYEEMARRAQQGNCTFERFDVSGGKIDAVMNCVAPQGGKARITLNGTGTSTASIMDMKMHMEAPGMGKMNTHTKVESTRVGPCPAS